MSFQEIFVTVVAAFALLVLVRPFLPYPLGPRRQRGPNCAACAAAHAPKATLRASDRVARSEDAPAGVSRDRPR